jgi:glycosyltransferase involved in cell wall biosynthesis
MRISVLIPCWNAEAYVGDAIRSVIEQDVEPDEIIVVDDGSNDRSAAIAEAFGPAVSLLRQANRGVGAALNLAIANATGDVIAFLDADDLWLPGKLAVQIAALTANPVLDGVFAHMRAFVSPDLSAEQRAAVAVSDETTPAFVKNTLLLRRQAFDRFGTFDEDRRHADFIAWYARASTQGFCWQMLPNLVSLRRIHATNMGRISRVSQREDYLLVMKELIERKRAKPGPDR